MRIGYACLNLTLKNKGKNRRMTVTQASKMAEFNRYLEIKKRTRENFANLLEVVIWNIKNNILLYRVCSNLIVLNNHEINTYVWDEDEYILDICKDIKKLVNENDVILTMHPDQFNVLNSDKEIVIRNTIDNLESLYKICELLGIKIMCLHVGSKVNGVEEGKKRFINTFSKLPVHLKNIICLENDDKSYNVENTLNLCELLDIRMILDLHHDRCNKSRKKVNKYIDRIKDTWKYEMPKCHISSGLTSEVDKRHADYINKKDLKYYINIVKNDFNIMVEAKKKELAVLEIVDMLK